ncbi:hypothetical protein [Nannocystis radixulma]|uniref:Uncharacterized protein n=1 Tax=Nannocystis radixulma TaxID=2995305 RepID=A0ABT5BPJ0_9BACT|nr:hypothetical protein [Nannocystis radixulma]MDC0676084.1 hypothetical protein [Nannocystis radixulma]
MDAHFAPPPAPPASRPPARSGQVFLAASTVRRAARLAEIRRDEELVAEALVDALRRVIAVKTPRTPEQIRAELDAAVKRSDEAQRALNIARISLRSRRNILYADSAPLPASIAAYRHRGNYRGAFGSMSELGNCLRSALGIVSGLTIADRTAIARNLHLHGDIWTLEHQGAVHVFGRPGSGADLILASERPSPDALVPREAPAS